MIIETNRSRTGTFQGEILKRIHRNPLDKLSQLIGDSKLLEILRRNLRRRSRRRVDEMRKRRGRNLRFDLVRTFKSLDLDLVSSLGRLGCDLLWALRCLWNDVGQLGWSDREVLRSPRGFYGELLWSLRCFFGKCTSSLPDIHGWWLSFVGTIETMSYLFLLFDFFFSFSIVIHSFFSFSFFWCVSLRRDDEDDGVY